MAKEKVVKEKVANDESKKEKRRQVMSDSAYRILVVVLLIMILIGVVADVAMQIMGGRDLHGGRGGFMQFGPGGKGKGGDQERGPQRDQGQGWLPGLELSAA